MREPKPTSKPVIRPSMRAGSKANIRRAAETRRSEQRAASAKQKSSPTSNVTKHPKGHKSGSAPYVAPAKTSISPADRAGSMMNIKRAAQTNRAGQRAAASASAASTKKSVATGTGNKLKAQGTITPARSAKSISDAQDRAQKARADRQLAGYKGFGSKAAMPKKPAVRVSNKIRGMK